jgi:hypothetical protein
MMSRERIYASALLTVGLVITGGAVVSRYASLFDPAPRDDLARLIHQALGEADGSSPLPHGDSILSKEGVALSAVSGDSAADTPALARRLYSGRWGSAGEPGMELQPTVWAGEAAMRDPAALRAWLGWAVMPVATTDGDTVRLRMYRPRMHPGCPMIDRIDATLTRPTGSWDTRIVRVDGGCWE